MFTNCHINFDNLTYTPGSPNPKLQIQQHVQKLLLDNQSIKYWG